MDFLIGLIGALVGVGIFCFGIWFGRQLDAKTEGLTVEVPEEEAAELQAERDRLIADQKAFRELMNYNANMAYGVKTTE